MKVFPLNHLLCAVHNGMSLMHRESVPVNGVFSAQPPKFSPSKVLPYTVSLFPISYDILRQNFGDLHEIGIKLADIVCIHVCVCGCARARA